MTSKKTENVDQKRRLSGELPGSSSKAPSHNGRNTSGARNSESRQGKRETATNTATGGVSSHISKKPHKKIENHGEITAPRGTYAEVASGTRVVDARRAHGGSEKPKTVIFVSNMGLAALPSGDSFFSGESLIQPSALGDDIYFEVHHLGVVRRVDALGSTCFQAHGKMMRLPAGARTYLVRPGVARRTCFLRLRLDGRSWWRRASIIEVRARIERTSRRVAAAVAFVRPSFETVKRRPRHRGKGSSERRKERRLQAAKRLGELKARTAAIIDEAVARESLSQREGILRREAAVRLVDNLSKGAPSLNHATSLEYLDYYSSGDLPQPKYWGLRWPQRFLGWEAIGPVFAGTQGPTLVPLVRPSMLHVSSDPDWDVRDSYRATYRF